jgi:GAF domain-containing protein
VHVADVHAEAEEFPESSHYWRRHGTRTSLSVPLMREGVAIGTIHLRRTEAQLFTEWQVALLQTFADQAVVAIENARLFEAEQARTKELRESLEYQTATSGVLHAISRSPNELQPVLDTIVRTARRLCGAERAIVTMLRDGKYHLVAHDGIPPDYVEYLTWNPFLPDRGSVIGRAALERKAVQIPNVLVDPEYRRAAQTIHRQLQPRTALGVPLLRKGEVIGVIAMGHTEVTPFTEKQIELVATFADQAVIAINNVGLFEEVQARTRELQESLEYQTAISDVLGVISRSPHELQPVLDTIVDTAKRLCAADRAFFGVLREGCWHLAATSGVPENIIKDFRDKPIVLSRGSSSGRAFLEKSAIHIEDVRLDPEFTLYDVNEPNRGRTLLSVPLLRGDSVIGVISVARVASVPFTQRQIDLVTTFADQAVIAINNVGLFEEVQARTKELTEFLKQQTATADVLKVISRSAFDLQKVLDTLVESAARLCEAERASVYRREDTNYHLAARHGHTPQFQEYMEHHPISLDRGSTVGRAILEGKPVQIGYPVDSSYFNRDFHVITMRWGHVYSFDVFEDSQEVTRGLAVQAKSGLKEAIAEQIVS